MNYNIWYKIIRRCDSTDLRNLASLCPDFLETMKSFYKPMIQLDPSFNDLIYEKFVLMGLDPIEFSQTIYLSDMVITGWFVLCALTTKEYKKNTIFLYTKDSNYSNEPNNYLHSYLINHPEYKDISREGASSTEIKYCLKYEFLRVKIVIYYLDRDIHLLDYMNKKSCTTLCKNYFDGKNFYISDISILSGMGYIDLFRFNDSLQNKEQLKTIFEQIANYFDNAYVIINFEEFVNRYKKYKKFNKVLIKYSNFE